MSDEGERTCPLCAEEMDLTDQHLKPCKCGYQICVWCWHHIMDMAEKDDTEGRCPACRSPYDKNKIVGMAANCERLVAEVHMEKRLKNQKAKSKSYEGRKQLSNVRVIQRNLVYIVGLPLNLGDEDLLQRREYFGQYGKVLKVSMSRTAAGVVQQFPNNTCSVYITYSKEEEAVRCIQNVHGFVLEDRPLRACFGTTKYCHAWLRNMPCSNPDCLYLHEIGSQEDSFSKDEIRGRVQQITGAANNMQQRSGTVLPPPLDDCMNNSPGKPIIKNASSSSASLVRGSPPNGSSGSPIGLPAAAWGSRTTNSPPAAGGTLCPNGPSKPRSDTMSNALPCSLAVADTNQASLHSELTTRPLSSDESHSMTSRVKNESLKPVIQYNSVDSSDGEKTLPSDVSLGSLNLNNQLSSLSLARVSDKGSCTTTNTTNSTDITGQLCSFGPEEAIIATNEYFHNLSSELSSINNDRSAQNEHYSLTKPSTPPFDSVLVKCSQSQGSQINSDKIRDSMITSAAVSAATSDNGVCNSKEWSDLRFDSQPLVLSGNAEVEDDVASFDNQRLKDPEVVSRSYLPKSSSFLHASNGYSPHLLQHCDHVVANAGSISIADKVGNDSLLHAPDILCNGYPKKLASISSYSLPYDERNKQCNERLVTEAVNTGSGAALDKGESTIISNIFSMEFDGWGDSLTSPKNLAKLLGDNTDNQNGPLNNSSTRKVQSNNQSRFSFARQEESNIDAFNLHPSYSTSQQFPNSCSLMQEFSERDVSMDKFGIANGFHASLEESEILRNGHFLASSNKPSVVSRSQISAPPGFSVPSRLPPPGFSSNERMGHAVDSFSGNRLLNPSSLRSNSYQTPSTVNNGGAGDIEFMDPAILAVGKGRLHGALISPLSDMRSNYPPQLNYFENEARLQIPMQRSFSPQQNLRFSEFENNFSLLGDSYGISSRLDQSQMGNLASYSQLSMQQSRNAALSNGQWETGNTLDMAELSRNERLGLNKFYKGYDDSKYRMPNSGDLYKRTFGI
ncbi:putative transcription factor C2H2 family [Lupinus albus]|uniref:Putative transcription factor C2H2 family n=1 Tax=Lupinus albus TaxID=3870 RepID=A0A6A4PGL9_LUPAL|nr:putative transcription factor C2H2 family [Lupinus albus]